MQSTKRGLGNHQASTSVIQHEGDALWGIGGIERQVGAAGFEDAEQPDHHLQRALDAQADDRLRPNAEALQVMRKLIGARIEFTIGERLFFEHHGYRIWRALRLGSKQFRQCRGLDRNARCRSSPEE